MTRLVLVLLAMICLMATFASGVPTPNDTGDLLNKMIEARGGQDKLSGIRTCVMKGTIVLVAQGGLSGDVSITNVYPDKVLIEMIIAGASIIQGYDGSTAWIDNPFAGGIQELPAEEATAMKHQAVGEGAFLNPQKYGIKYEFKGQDTDSAVEYAVLEQSFDDGSKSVLHYLDKSSHLIHKSKTYKGTPVQPLIEEIYYTDYRETNGITQAHHVSTFSNGQEAISFQFDQVEYNVDIDPEVFKMAAKRFAKSELIADARQLAGIIENTHPDPYQRIGGRIAFHRELQHILYAIPADGMTSSEFTGLLRPFVALIGDGHTEVYADHNVNPAAPGGIPLKFDVVEQGLFVSGVPGDEYKTLFGARLISVEGVSIDELGKRLRAFRPIDNEYHLLWHLTTNYLWYGAYLREVLPEWTDTNRIRFNLRLASGKTREVVFDLPMTITSLSEPESEVTLPAVGESGFAYSYFRSDKKVAFVRIDHMQYYRETFEARNSLGLEQTPQAKLDSIPSATEFFRSLVTEMKTAGTESMIVDLRHNGGGDALMADIMLYFLYGKDTTLQTRWSNITRLSRTYLDARKGMTLEDLNKGRAVSLVEGEYDFSEDYSDSILCDTAALAKEFARASTFSAEWDNGTYAGHYCPRRVIVLTRPWTYSAGFGIAVRLFRAGAVLVGTPSGQSPNSGGGNAVKWRLDNTGVSGRVSQSCTLNFPDNSEFARVLSVHYPMKYNWLASHHFDPNAEILYALELLPKLAKLKK